jgi:hypothetical protein
MSDKSQVAATDTVNGQVEQLRPAQKMRQYMLARAQMGQADRAADVLDTQVDRIIGAQTEKEIWDADAGGTVQARDAVGMEVEILSFEPVESTRQDIETRSGYYISMDAVCLGGPEEVLTKNGLEIGQEFALQTGADLIVAKVRAFEAQDLLPVRAVIVGITTQRGNLLKLRPLPKRAISK